LVVQLPGVKNFEEAKRLIGQTARLEFKLRECEDAMCAKYEDKDAGGLTGDHLSRAFADRHQTTGEPIVSIQFNSKGTEIFAELTRRMAGDPTKRIAIFLDEQELLAPVVQSPILTGSGFISGPDFTPQRVRTIAIQIESGRLPVPLRLIEESDVDALLGSESLRASLKAGAISLGLIMLFMVVYYRMGGVLASLALLMYGVVMLAIFKMLPVTLTLPGIAGFIISLGMALDANVLIFERMKEELRAGRPILSAIDAGFSRAWAAIWDSNVTTFIICAIIYWFGSRTGTTVVSGFAFTLFIGVATSMFSAIFVSKNLLHLAARTGLGRRVNLFTPETLARPLGAPTGGGD
jgi:preprotein translocase subunit SecD